MAAPAKLVQIMGFLGKEEATYGTAIAVTTTADGIQLQYENRDYPWASIEYAFDGDLGPSVGNLGTVLRAAQGGQSVKFEAVTRAKGAGAAYSATVVPSIHRLLKAAGFDAASVTTASSEKWTYTPTGPGTTYTSLTTELYGRGEKFPCVGMISDWSFDFTNQAPPIHKFTLSGLLNSAVVDVATPTITYPLTSIQAPLAQNVSLTLGSLTTNAVILSGSFTLGREILARSVLSGTAGHLGFIPRGIMPDVKVVLEATALVGSPYTGASAFDPYLLQSTGQNFAFTVQFGATQYFRWKLVSAQAQVTAAAPTVVNGIACWELTIRPYTSTPVANDAFTIVFD